VAPIEKPWLSNPERGATASYFTTLLCIFLGLAGAAILCWQGVSNVLLLDQSKLCLVLSEDFSSQDLDTSTWTKDVELGGFGNGEFQMTTDSPSNLFLSNGQLYIVPTLTSDIIPLASIFNGGNFTLQGCTSTNQTACSVESNAALGTVINPVQSARITTQGKKNIRFGKVEVRAKLPRGDWLWPAIWMLPENNTYGPWPASGEIDIVEARGNGPTYPAQGSNFVRSSLNYGPLPSVLNQIYGWFSLKRSSLDQAFHTYTLEWDSSFMRFYTDSRLHAMLETQTRTQSIGGKVKSFWEKAGFPLTAINGSSGAEVVVTNPWAGRGPIAPFDQSFYLIIDLAVGGTSGWFPDNKGGKPWYDGSLTATRDFARAQNIWSATWPTDPNDGAFRIDYVKMWEQC
jgi:beta-glucanase (GH16 family)